MSEFNDSGGLRYYCYSRIVNCTFKQKSNSWYVAGDRGLSHGQDKYRWEIRNGGKKVSLVRWKDNARFIQPQTTDLNDVEIIVKDAGNVVMDNGPCCLVTVKLTQEVVDLVEFRNSTEWDNGTGIDLCYLWRGTHKDNSC